MHSSESHIYDALNAGADGYVLKEDDHDQLINAIKSILNGNKFPQFIKSDFISF